MLCVVVVLCYGYLYYTHTHAHTLHDDRTSQILVWSNVVLYQCVCVSLCLTRTNNNVITIIRFYPVEKRMVYVCVRWRGKTAGGGRRNARTRIGIPTKKCTRQNVAMPKVESQSRCGKNTQPFC